MWSSRPAFAGKDNFEVFRSFNGKDGITLSQIHSTKTNFFQ